jgi:dihydrofolate reductase
MSFAGGGSLTTMGTLIYGMNVSADGYVADAKGDFDWSEPNEELHQYWNDVTREVALSFYGRRLYDLMSAYWPTADQDPEANPVTLDYARAWLGMPKVVFSQTLESVDWNSRLERGDPVEVATRLKAETDGLLEVGGATLASTFVRAGLVDGFRIVVHPVVVGGGTPFFPSLPSWLSLRLVESRSFSGGAVLLRYDVKR